ncbi:hypothetical protein K474DRAFT_1689533 [Panus rudis PR-1116 ss-1]|nr:hypothetical protein K474DRAFT_1689533 [Panus rudis PR-1116 ss-1]
MDDDLIVVDDIDDSQSDAANSSQAGPSTQTPRNPAQHALGTRHSTRRRNTPDVYYGELPDPGSEARETRSTRSSNLRPRVQPKLKLKLSEKAAAKAPGMSFLGPYDRELDSDEEDDLVFEEQFILRMAPGEDCDKLRRMVENREVSQDVWFKFKDSRRAVFHIGNNLYSAKLVDLPCIIESQKTLDNKHMFKVADICQMLVVEERIPNEDVVTQQKNFNIDEFIWPHGITPPLHHVRKRRFRKRLARSQIETVEQEVERLLESDALASEIKYDVLENVNPDLSDSEFLEREEPLDVPTPGFGESEMGEAMTPGADVGGEEGEEEHDEEGDEGEGDFDEELAAQLDLALGDEDGGAAAEDAEEGDEDEDEDEEDTTDEDEEDEDDELAQTRKLLNEEIRDLEAAVAKKNNEIASSANPLIKRRFEDALKKLQADLDMKKAQREEMKEKQRLQKEGINPEDVDTEGGNDGDVDEDGEGGLFGDEDDMAMDIG